MGQGRDFEIFLGQLRLLLRHRRLPLIEQCRTCASMAVWISVRTSSSSRFIGMQCRQARRRLAYLLNNKLSPPAPNLNDVLRLIARAGGILAKKGDSKMGFQDGLERMARCPVVGSNH